jgi:hypothetical protein
MIEELRSSFNKNFQQSDYVRLLELLNEGFPEIPFKVAETPVFLPDSLIEKLSEAANDIIDFIKEDNFKTQTQKSIPKNWLVPNENKHPHFLTFDFGITKNQWDEAEPMLIEMQGFPSLYGFQPYLANAYKKAYHLPDELSPYFNDLTDESYFDLLKTVLIGDYQPEEVVLMDIDAHHQKTVIDFYVTAQKTGIKVMALEDIQQEGKKLYYTENGKKTQIKRIYNRLIFDEIGENTEIFNSCFDPREELDVEWITHPNWFYRISKYTMPFLRGKYFPKTYFLNEVHQIPQDLENYVLKPLFSFAGMGVIIDVKESDIENIKDPENWILQKKVEYHPFIKSPDGNVKLEIRLMYLWPEGEEPKLCLNLVRLSRGKMIGVRYNDGFNWVGGSVGLH